MENERITFEEIMDFHVDNRRTFNSIVSNIQNIVPFIGAGLSAFAYPLWNDFLEDVFKKLNWEEKREFFTNKLKRGKYEEAASFLSKERGPVSFNEDIRESFAPYKLNAPDVKSLLEKQAVYLLPIIFRGLVITTNFDRVLEKVYESNITPFDGNVAHPGHNEMLNLALRAHNRTTLYKFHGDISEVNRLVLTKESYDKNYDINSDLVSELTKCFNQKCILFLGCSLNKDRTMSILQTALEEGVENYAIIDCKKEDCRNKSRELANRGIHTILYDEKDRKEAVRVILEKLIGTLELNQPNKIISNFTNHQNAYFTGREDILSKMKGEFDGQKDGLSIYLISGLGGVGKTQTVSEYILRNKTKYKLIWWINAKDKATIASAYYTLAQELELPLQDTNYESAGRNIKETSRRKVTTDRVCEWFERHGEWLLVFDNADTLDEITKYLPRWGNGQIIITSRTKNWGNITRLIHNLEVFEASEAESFLRKKLMVKGVSSTIGLNIYEEKQLPDLALLLGYLPLALEQAGSYIATGGSVSEYMDFFKHCNKEILRKGKPYYESQDTVDTTWDISFQRVNNKSRFAYFLMNIFSFCAADDIPYELLLSVEEVLMTHFNEKTIPLLLADARNTLNNYSLININIDKNSIYINRLVQAVIRNNLVPDIERMYTTIQMALCIVLEKFISYRISTNEKHKSSRLLPHALEISKYADEFNVSPEMNIKLMLEIGLYLWMLPQYYESKKIFINALAVASKYYKTIYNDDTADILNNLGLVHDEMGEYTKALLCYEKAVLINRHLHTSENSTNMINYLRNLGGLKNRLGICSEAMENYSEALGIAKIIYRDEEKNIAPILGDIGVIYESMGDYVSAKNYYEHSLSITAKYNIKDPCLVALCNENMGDILRLLGDYSQSEQHYLKALELYKDYYECDHPDIARNINKLGIVLSKLGLHKKALEMCNQALQMDRKFFGDDHPYIARNLRSLGAIYSILNKMSKAQLYFEKALTIDEKFYGPMHPDVARDILSLGNVFEKSGKLEAANAYYEKVLSIKKSIYGSGNTPILEF